MTQSQSCNQHIISALGEFPLAAASIRVTKACNAHCRHCYADAGKKASEELSCTKICSLIDQIADMGGKRIFFTGGEPFTRRDTVDILNHTDRRGLKVLISTNGSVATKEVLKGICHIPFDQFQVSLDGPGELHDANRGTGFFDRAIDCIRTAKQLGIQNVTVGTCITSQNVSRLGDIMSIAIANRADVIAPMLLLPIGRADKSMDTKSNDLISGLNEFFSIYREGEYKIRFAGNSVLPPVLVPKDLREAGLHKGFVTCCSYPHLIGIETDGSIAPCDGFFCWNRFVKKAEGRDLQKLWEEMYSDQNCLQQDLSNVEGVCSMCKFLRECWGGCRAAAYAYYGSLTAPFPTCQRMFEDGLFPKDCLI